MTGPGPLTARSNAIHTTLVDHPQPAERNATDPSAADIAVQQPAHTTLVHVPQEQRAEAMRLARLFQPSRLQQEVSRGQSEHSRPFMISFPVGPVTISTGAKIMHSNKMQISLQCDDIDNPNVPCFLVYEGRTKNGALLGFGAGVTGTYLSGSVYGGHTRAQSIAFKRRVDDVTTRKALQAACMKKQTPKDALWLAPYFEIPAPTQIQDFKVGEMWEQTAEARFSGGATFGCVAQQIDAGADITGHFVVRTEKTSDDTALCTVVPVKFTRYTTALGNLAENAVLDWEQTEGYCFTLRFRLSSDTGAAAYRGLVGDGIVPDASMAALEGPEDVALVQRETVSQATFRRHLKLLGGVLALETFAREATRHVESLDGSHTLEITSRNSATTQAGNKVHNDWEVMGIYEDRVQDGRQQKLCKGVTVYKHIAMKAGLRTKSEESDRNHQKARNAQLQALSKELRHSLPNFTGLQARGDLAVQALLFLTPAHIDALAQMTENDVFRAAAELDLSTRDTEKALDYFRGARAVDAAVERAKRNGQIILDESARASNALAIENDATAKRAAMLHRMLTNPDMLKIVTGYLHEIGKLPEPILRVACPTYQAARQALDDIEVVRQSLSQDETPSGLQATFTRLAEIRKTLRHALEIADGDTLTATFMPDAWVSVQREWRAGLQEIGNIAKMETLSARSDNGAKIMEPVSRAATSRFKALGSGFRHLQTARIKSAFVEKPLFDAVPIGQRVGLLGQEIIAGRRVETHVKALAQCVRDLRAEIKACDVRHAKKEGLGYIVRWERQNLLDTLVALRRQPFVNEHPVLQKEMERAVRERLFVPNPRLAPRAGDWTSFGPEEPETTAASLPPLPTGPLWKVPTRR